jgi:hypothetical protein
MGGYLELEGKRALVTGGTKGIGEARQEACLVARLSPAATLLRLLSSLGSAGLAARSLHLPCRRPMCLKACAAARGRTARSCNWVNRCVAAY